ncbi:MAG TPA: RNA polymerase sigma factor, partial [Dehalococcoidia bacterium]|nr:RNA polymerase sigma factor [Dehalococcoidia bacterium]
MQAQPPERPPREELFAALYEDMSGRVYNLVLRSVHDRALAEDVCQEVWLKVHRRIDGLRDLEALRAWVFRTAVRACIDFSRSRAGKERAATAPMTESVQDPAHDPEDAALNRLDLDLAWETLANLSPRQSAAIYLRQVEGYSYRQIAAVLRCSTSAVESLLFRAREAFASIHERMGSGQAQRCRMMRRVMAVVLDDEGTTLQQNVVRAHLRSCPTCRAYVQSLSEGDAAYASLPMAIGAGPAVVAAAPTGLGSTGGVAGLGRIFAPLLAQGKALALASAFAGALAIGAAAAAVAGLTPPPAQIVAQFVNAGNGDSAPPGGQPDAGRQDPLGLTTSAPAPTPAAPPSSDDNEQPAQIQSSEPSA